MVTLLKCKLFKAFLYISLHLQYTAECRSNQYFSDYLILIHKYSISWLVHWMPFLCPLKMKKTIKQTIKMLRCSSAVLVMVLMHKQQHQNDDDNQSGSHVDGFSDFDSTGQGKKRMVKLVIRIVSLGI